MFCSKCGVEIPDDAQFCPKCGTPVRITAMNQSVETDDMAITKDINQNKVKNKSPKAVRTFSAPVMLTTIILSGIGCVFSIATLIAYLQSMRPEVMAIAYICVVAGIAFVSLVCCLMLKKKPIFTVVPVCLLAGIDFLFFKDGIYHIQRPVHLFIFEYCNSNIGESISVAVGIVMPIAAVLYLISVFTKGYARKIFSGIAAVLFCLSLGLFIPLLVKMPSYWSEFIPVQEGYATPDLNTFSAWLAVGIRLVSYLCFAAISAGSILCSDEVFQFNLKPRQKKKPRAMNYENPNVNVTQPVGDNSGYTASAPGDARSGGYAVLCFLFPMIGLILYLVWKDQYPLRAKSCGKGALIGVIGWPILGALFYLIVYFVILNLLL